MSSILTAARWLRPTIHWRRRCTSCGATEGVMTTRFLRVAFRSPVLVAGYCRTCRGVRMVMMEPAARTTVPRRDYL